MAINAREAALKALGAFRRSRAWPEAFLNNLIIKEGISELDAALATRICYGVLQNKGICDYYINYFSSVKPGKIEPIVYDILELSVYQLIFMDKIPVSASVNEAVKLTKKSMNPKASGFVNAVLRKISENVGKLPEVLGKTIEETLSIKYSHPMSLINLFKRFMSIEEIERLLISNNEPVQIAVQVNTLKTDSSKLLAALAQEETEAILHPWLDDCLLLKNLGRLGNSKAFADGLFTIQDTASRLAVMAAAPKAGHSVLDACSAPGGKAFMAAMMMRNTGSILAADIHENKLIRISAGASRLGIKILNIERLDAAEPNPELFAKFDLVIADVPCSGLGIIRKKPEIRFRDFEELKALPEVQSKIINNVSKYVKPGGVLMYSTCTIMPEENEGIINGFLSKNSEFMPESFVLPDPIGEAETGMLTLYPHIHGTDGFFMCKMRKDNCSSN